MKINISPDLRCTNCYFCKKKGKIYIRCRINPRHKQRQWKKIKTLSLTR